MAVTTGNVTEYSHTDLAHEARWALKGHLCPDCGRQLKVKEWKLSVTPTTTGLSVTGFCSLHPGYQLYRSHAI